MWQQGGLAVSRPPYGGACDVLRCLSPMRLPWLLTSDSISSYRPFDFGDVYLSVFLSVCLSVYLSVWLYVYAGTRLAMRAPH